jgi:hypothetical protein
MVKAATLVEDEGINPPNESAEAWMTQSQTPQPQGPIERIHDMIGQVTSLTEKQDFIGANRVISQANTLISMGISIAEQRNLYALKASLIALRKLLDEEKRKLEILQNP